MMLVLRLMMLLLLMVVQQQGIVHGQWDAEPQSVSVPLGGDTRITCGVRDKGVVWKQYAATESSTIMFVNASAFNAPSRFSVARTAVGFDLVLTGAQREDDTDYECEVQGVLLKRRVTITVTGEIRCQLHQCIANQC